jgi:hypothetical protein
MVRDGFQTISMAAEIKLYKTQVLISFSLTQLHLRLSFL